MEIRERTNIPTEDPLVERVHLYLLSNTSPRSNTNWGREMSKLVFGLLEDVLRWEK